MKRPLHLFAVAAVLLVPRLAHAAANATSEAVIKDADTGYAYDFIDDLVNGNGIDANAARIKVRPGHVRRTLIRPRLHFVPELLESVELI